MLMPAGSGSRVAVFIAACLVALPLRAEVQELRISRQYGLPYLVPVILEDQRLIEKHAKARGLGEMKITWTTLGTGGTSTDSLLAGNLDFVVSGISNMMLLWSRTGGQVKAVSAMAAVPLLLLTRNPNVKTIADLTEKDRIAVPTIKVSMQSTILGIAAAKLYGDAGRTKFDPLTVSMAAPDAAAALVSGGELNNHFSVPPYQYQSLKTPGVRTLLSSTEVMGGPATITVFFGTVKFHDANPNTMAAINAAIAEAMDFIGKNKRAAAQTYQKATKDKMSVDELAAMFDLPGFAFTMAPHGTMQYAEHMFKTGVIKTRPAIWKDVFFSEAHSLPGN
jgi:NitT/TauT family transport system substrate-binding protein